MNKSVADTGIPTLTEIIGPATGNRVSERSSERSSAGPATINRPAQREPVAAPPRTGWSDGEWLRMEQQVSERVLQQMMGRIDFVLEQRVRDSLADVLQTAVEVLSTEIRQGLHETLKDVITRAVSQEIARLQATRK